jgi:hypothetical protein
MSLVDRPAGDDDLAAELVFVTDKTGGWRDLIGARDKGPGSAMGSVCTNNDAEPILRLSPKFRIINNFTLAIRISKDEFQAAVEAKFKTVGRHKDFATWTSYIVNMALDSPEFNEGKYDYLLSEDLCIKMPEPLTLADPPCVLWADKMDPAEWNGGKWLCKEGVQIHVMPISASPCPYILRLLQLWSNLSARGVRMCEADKCYGCRW